MHFATFTTALLAAVAPLAQAKLDLLFAPSDGLIVDHEYNITWTSDTNYTTWIKLVRQTGDGWHPVDKVISNQYTPSGEQKINYWVPDVPSHEHYAIYIYGEDPLSVGEEDGPASEADLTDWFSISGGSPQHKGLSKAGIAGLAVGVVVAVGMLGAAAWWLVRRRRARRAEVEAVVEVAPPLEVDPPRYSEEMEMEGRRVSEDSIESQKERARLASK